MTFFFCNTQFECDQQSRDGCTPETSRMSGGGGKCSGRDMAVDQVGVDGELGRKRIIPTDLGSDDEFAKKRKVSAAPGMPLDARNL